MLAGGAMAGEGVYEQAARDTEPQMAFVPPARHLLRAKDLADARYFEPLDVDDLAGAAGLSRAHFSREFRRAFGESPHAYLLTRRLERAAALLRTTDHSVAEICFSVGLQSVGSFTTSFTRTYGVVADRVPRDVPAGRRARADPGVRRRAPTAARNAARFEKTARRRATSLARRPFHLRQGAHDDQDRQRAAVGPRPGRGARVLHRRSSAWRCAPT